MSPNTTTQILSFLVPLIAVLLIMTDSPAIFRFPQARFMYRSGLLLYSQSFSIPHQPTGITIPRWQIEHWMAESGFTFPLAEADGDRRYLLMEFVNRIIPIPKPLRGVISWDEQQGVVVVRGFATWTYFVFLGFFSFLPFAVGFNAGASEFTCLFLPLFAFLIWSLIVGRVQTRHLRDLGKIVAEFCTAPKTISDSVSAPSKPIGQAG